MAGVFYDFDNAIAIEAAEGGIRRGRCDALVELTHDNANRQTHVGNRHRETATAKFVSAHALKYARFGSGSLHHSPDPPSGETATSRMVNNLEPLLRIILRAANKARVAASNGTAPAPTGVTATMRLTLPGASTAIRCNLDAHRMARQG